MNKDLNTMSGLVQRDPNRIEPTLRILEAVWKENPDWRLGQLISNASYYATEHLDPFYVEDDTLVDGIRNLALRRSEQSA